MQTLQHKQIYEELCASKFPIFVCDERIDGDSLGSALAFVNLQQQQHRVLPSVFLSGQIPEIYQHLPHIEHCTTDVSIFQDKKIDLIVVFDCSDQEYVKRLVDLIPGYPRVINIDHHKTNVRYGDMNLVNTHAPATAEVVYGIFESNNIRPSKEAATCLLTGLCFDTTAFSNAATNDRAFQMASELVLCGARVQSVIRTMFKNRSVCALRVWGAALERLHFHPEYDCVITCITRKDIETEHIEEEEMEGLSNFLSLVTDTDTLYVFRETPQGHVKVSMRSSTRDVSVIARAHGGGGHERAAGYTIENACLVNGPDGIWMVEKKSEVRHHKK